MFANAPRSEIIGCCTLLVIVTGLLIASLAFAAHKDEVQAKLYQTRQEAIWDKKGMKLGCDFRPQHEIILVLEKGKPVYRRKDFADVQSFATVQHTADSHPHEKPLGLLKGMIAHSTQAGETILDPFMGSGSTGVAAAMMGRKFIGIELDPAYFDMACRRIEAAYKQGDFFGGNETPMEQVKLEL